MSRSPEEVVLGFLLDVRSSVGPWTFQVLHLTACGDLVEASWRQTGRVVEHGGARYRVEDGRIIEYWIEFRHDVASPEGALR